jgi:1-acyl-sn-glycerol-3-phosphate acyltransferase
MRRLAAEFLRWLAEACVRVYYPRRSIEGAEHVPAAGPALYVANHPNGLLDPLVLRVSIGRAVRFLAKSTLWGNPFGRLAMDAFRCLPVYRQQDVAIDERGRSVARNEESFARCRAALGAGEELALYPEGTSHSDPRLKPLRSEARFQGMLRQIGFRNQRA